MANKIKLEIKETVDELKELLRNSDNIKVKERLQVLKWYREGGLAKLIDIYQPQGKPCSIPALIVEKLKERLADPKGFNSYGEIKDSQQRYFTVPTCP